jgi:hypothetical protein
VHLAGYLGLHNVRQRVSFYRTEGHGILGILDGSKGLIHRATCGPPRRVGLSLNGTQRVVSRSDSVIVEFAPTLKVLQKLGHVSTLDQSVPASLEHAEQLGVCTHGAFCAC